MEVRPCKRRRVPAHTGMSVERLGLALDQQDPGCAGGGWQSRLA